MSRNTSDSKSSRTKRIKKQVYEEPKMVKVYSEYDSKDKIPEAFTTSGCACGGGCCGCCGCCSCGY